MVLTEEARKYLEWRKADYEARNAVKGESCPDAYEEGNYIPKEGTLAALAIEADEETLRILESW
jgi:hypothetical protein